MKPEIRTKMLKKLIEKLGAKFPVTTHFARLDDAFLEVFLIASKPSRKPITAVKRKAKKKNSKIEKPKDVGHFLVQKLLKPPKCPGVNGLTYQNIGTQGVQELFFCE